METKAIDQPKLECSLCHTPKIDDDLTVEPDGSRLCGQCWLKAGVESGKLRVRPRGRPPKPQEERTTKTAKLTLKLYPEDAQYFKEMLGTGWLEDKIEEARSS